MADDSVHNLGFCNKTNCWQFKRCGRHPGGEKVDEMGLCPAATDKSHDGINCGENAGRHCWRVAGTFCGGKVQGTYAKKMLNCINCEFFKQVQEEEGNTFRH